MDKSNVSPFMNMSFDGTRSRLIILDDGNSLKGGAKAFCEQFNSINDISYKTKKMAWVQFNIAWYD